MIPRGKQHYRSLEHDKLQALYKSNWCWDKKCNLSMNSQIDILWWMNNIPNTSANIQTTNLTRFLHAWGGVFKGHRAQGFFLPAERDLSINTKETLAIWYSFQSFKSMIKNCHLLIESDNTTAVAYICDMGGMKLDLCNKIAADVWDLADDFNTTLSITYLLGKFNGEADMASRILSCRTEWALPQVWFDKLCTHFCVKLDIDMFASWLNTKLESYVSYAPDLFCKHVDAFTCSWQGKFIYAFAPFNIIHRVLQKIRQDQCSALIVYPLWPNQPWFTTLHSMSVSTPVQLPASCKLFLPWNTKHQHPNENLRLCSTVVSGTDCNLKATMKTQSIKSTNHSESQHEKITLPMFHDGYCFVLKGKLITCDQL